MTNEEYYDKSVGLLEDVAQGIKVLNSCMYMLLSGQSTESKDVFCSACKKDVIPDGLGYCPICKKDLTLKITDGAINGK